MIEIDLGKNDRRCESYWEREADDAVAKARRTGREDDWSLADAAVEDYHEVYHPRSQLSALLAAIAVVAVIASIVFWAAW